MKCKKLICALVLLFLGYCVRLSAKPVSAEKAQQAVTGWLKADARPLGAVLGKEISKVDAFSDEQGQVIYYVVYLQPSGFVIVPADDLVEPILAFAEGDTYDSSPDNPLTVLVNKDVRGRIAASRDAAATQNNQVLQKTTFKWQQLIDNAQQFAGPDILGLPAVNDPRVDPLLNTKWWQTTCCDEPELACYNYYTPPSDPWDPCDELVESLPGSPNPYGDPDNYPCGCIATAMAQVMRYHKYPINGIGKIESWIKVNAVQEDAWTRGGDGAGGPYNWDLMVYEPDCDTNEVQQRAIGALCYDAGVSVHMNYTQAESEAFMSDVDDAFTDVFKYSNAIYKAANPVEISDLKKMINPNLDFAKPVLISFNTYDPDHTVVADGYGYENGTMYHHLNMGWGGNQNAWYNFYDDMPAGFATVDSCIYNIFVKGTGEIISGRVTHILTGKPLAGVSVGAIRNGGGKYKTRTNDRGIYALANLPSASRYTIKVSGMLCFNCSRVVDIGTSANNGAIGNYWGADFPFRIRFVDLFALGINDGTSWDDAYNNLQDALADPCASIIWVADGTYKPDQGGGHTPGDRNAAFVLKNGVAIFGGFAGCGAPNPNARDTKLYETILSGDLAGNDVYINDPCNLLTEPTRAENSYHVVVGSNTDANVVLDGFTITAGNADSGVWPDNYGGGLLNEYNANCIVNNCTFIENSSGGGGAIFNNSSSNLNVTNCIFFRNAGGSGGGIMNYSSSPALVNCSFISNKGTDAVNNGGGLFNMQQSHPAVTNCLFRNNSAQYGGGISNTHASVPMITNCTFSDNLATGHCGGINDYNNSSPTIANCILWDNTNPQIWDSLGSAAMVNFSDVQGGWGGAGVGNINIDPRFVNADGPDGFVGTLDDNLHLLSDSPCIDKGNNSSVPADIADLDGDTDIAEQTPLDLDNRSRFADGDCNDSVFVDMGAYEFAYVGDFDADCAVDFYDFALLADSWLQDDPLRDIAPPPEGDGIVDIYDLAILCDNWLAGK
ncbi:MAG: C10 family peptidase [Sedimentisphaerales bacterium]|nr:C10 family peptidase [Sedimentisphaerales bacterium]